MSSVTEVLLQHYLNGSALALDVTLISYGTNLLKADNNLAGGGAEDLYLPRRSEERDSWVGCVGFDDTSSEGPFSPGEFHPVRSIFYAVGPSFKAGYVGSWFNIVDEYQVQKQTFDYQELDSNLFCCSSFCTSWALTSQQLQAIQETGPESQIYSQQKPVQQPTSRASIIFCFLLFSCQLQIY